MRRPNDVDGLDDWNEQMEQQNIGAQLMALQIRRAIESGSGHFSDENAEWIVQHAKT